MAPAQTSEFIVERILPDVRDGRMVILVDSADRENEGDLFVAAEKATPEAINFMATHGRGLISLALTEARMRELGLTLIAEDQVNTTRFRTAFATPIDAREGVGSGMSASRPRANHRGRHCRARGTGGSDTARPAARRCARSMAACSRGADIPRPPSTSHGWRGSSPRA